MPTMDRLTWIHLSDLHFGHGDATTRFDQMAVMEAILDDVESVAAERGSPDCIFVTGDIAFSAAQAEYDDAGKWLDSLLEKLKLKRDRVLLVPGNHDVNRKARGKFPEPSYVGYRSKPQLVDSAFEKLPEMEALWPKLEDYARFAKSYGDREITPARPFWRAPIESALGRVVAIGLNTTLLSFDDTDGPNPKNLRLGAGQITRALEQIPQDALILVLQHHPPAWLGDGAELLARLQRYPHILLSGHVHDPNGVVVQSFISRGGVQFVAGAGHQGPGEEGKHAYAWGTLHRQGLDYQPRAWSKKERTFLPEPTNAPSRAKGWTAKGGEWTCMESAKLPDALQGWLAQSGRPPRVPGSASPVAPAHQPEPKALSMRLPESARNRNTANVRMSALESTVNELEVEREKLNSTLDKVTDALEQGSLKAVREALGMHLSNPSRPRAHFGLEWLLPVVIVILLPILSAMAMCVSPSDQHLWVHVRNGADYFQLAVVLLFTVVVWYTSPARLDETWKDRAACVSSIAELVGCWKNLWVSWAFIYVIYSLQHILEHAKLENELHFEWISKQHWLSGWAAGLTFAINLQNWSMFVLFWEMFRPTTDVKEAAHRWPVGRWALVFCFVYTALEIALVFAEVNVSLWAGLLAGVISAVCYGLFVGRLESVLLAVHPVQLVVLYLYAATQPLYPIARLAPLGKLSDNPPADLLFQFIIKALSLALKLGMFFVVTRLFKSGRLAFFMWKTRASREDTPVEWELFKQNRLRP